MTRFQVGDEVKSRHNNDPAMGNDVYIVEEVLYRIGNPYYISRKCDGSRVIYPIPHDTLLLVCKSRMTKQDRAIMELKKEIQQLRHRIEQLERRS